MFKFRERKELKEENEKLKKENEELKKNGEELRHVIANAAKRNEELWDALNTADSQMYAFVKTVPVYVGNHSLEEAALTRWTNTFDEQQKALENLMFHSEYRGTQECGDERYWFG